MSQVQLYSKRLEYILVLLTGSYSNDPPIILDCLEYIINYYDISIISGL